MSKFLSLFLSLIATTGYAVECGDVPEWLKVREVSFRITEPTESYDLSIQFPDVTKLKCISSRLDWGTDYSFELGSSVVELAYLKDGKEKQKRISKMSYLNAHSVMLAVEREKTPHYFEVRDEELDVTYYIYFSRENGPSHARRRGSDRKFQISQSEQTGGLRCDNGKYSLVINRESKTAKVTHATQPETAFITEKFEVKGTQFPRFEIQGKAKALRYEGTRSAQWYEGKARVSTSANLVGDEIIYSAQFLIDYDPYYKVTSWDRCQRE